MKSRITIDIDHDNQPIIRIHYLESEDVRDFLVKRFLETFGPDSSYASFRFVDNSVANLNASARIRPIKPEEMLDVAKTIMTAHEPDKNRENYTSNGGTYFHEQALPQI